MSDTSAVPGLRSRPLRIAAVALAALLLTSVFVYLGFPYDRLVQRGALLLQSATGYRLSYGPVGPSLGLFGPGLAIADLRVTAPGGDTLSFSRIRLRPAWSLAWLTARPAIFVDAESPLGNVRGVATLRGPLAFDGEVQGLDLATLLAGRLPSGTRLTGIADVDADVALADRKASGTVSLSASNGTLGVPGFPIDLPYATIEGELRLGGEVTAEVVSLAISGPMGSGSVSGTIGAAPVVARAPLDLHVEIVASDQIRGSLEAQGVRVGRDGKVELQLGGTVASPRLARR